MWLLDANMDVHLISLFAEFGIPCEAATHRGWGGLANGELMAVANESGFTCILTQDRLFAQSAKKAIEETRGMAIVLVRLPQKPWREYIEQFRRAWANHRIEPMPGGVVFWPPMDD